MNVISEEFQQVLINEVTRQVDVAIREIIKTYAIRNRYLNKSKACVYAGITAPTLDQWLAKGLPISKIDGTYCIDTVDIDRFIKRHRIGEL